MVLTTSQLRAAYGPHCRIKDWGMEAAYKALDVCLQHFDYKPRSYDTGSYNCRPITGGTAYSLHAFRDDGVYIFWTGVKVTMALAVDINWQANPYGPRLVTDMPRAMVDAILAIRTNSGERVWGWGGYYSGNKDAMHYEIVCTPAALRSGIDPKTLPNWVPPQPTPVPTPPPPITQITKQGAKADMFCQIITPTNGIFEVMVGTDKAVYVRSANSLPELLGARASSLGGQAKGVSCFIHNGVLVVAAHGLDDYIHYKVFKSDWTWSDWMKSANILLHP